jgi:hypothetical protein
MSETLPPEYYEPDAPLSGSKFTPKMVLLVVFGALALSALLVCAAVVVLFYLGLPIYASTSAPSQEEFEVTMMEVDCEVVKSDLSAEICHAWAEQVYNDHPGLYMQCSAEAEGSDGRYLCYLDAGVNPPQ